MLSLGPQTHIKEFTIRKVNSIYLITSMTKNKTTRTDKPFKIVTVGPSELSKSVDQLIKKKPKPKSPLHQDLVKAVWRVEMSRVC